jgi:hypothetical protein
MQNNTIVEENTPHQANHQKTRPKDASRPYKKISVELVGDSAIHAEVLETSLSISQHARIKAKKDELLVSIALLSLEHVMDQCKQETGKRFPDYEDLMAFLQNQ